MLVPRRKGRAGAVGPTVLVPMLVPMLASVFMYVLVFMPVSVLVLDLDLAFLLLRAKLRFSFVHAALVSC